MVRVSWASDAESLLAALLRDATVRTARDSAAKAVLAS